MHSRTLSNASAGETSDSGGVAAEAEFLESSRARLLGLAYRILGSYAEAEDAVQDTFLRWRTTDRSTIDSPGAWLTTVCTRRAIDMLKASYRSRVDYVGSWLPEPIQTVTEHEADAQMDLASSLSTAFLLMLERLAPRERAAYLMHDIFEMSYEEVAASLDINEAACRKLVSRAKARLAKGEKRYQPTQERQRELVAAFENAVRTGQSDSFARLLVNDVRLTADGGGKVATTGEVSSADEVLAFVTQRLGEWWRPFEWEQSELNGQLGVILREAGRVVASVSFSCDGSGRIAEIFIVRNPDKLMRLKDARIH